MENTTAPQPTVSLVKPVTLSHCLGDGSPARPWVLHRIVRVIDGREVGTWTRDQRPEAGHALVRMLLGV